LTRKTGSTNHVRFTVSDIPRAEAFYNPLLGFMGYELAEKGETRLAWRMPSPAGNRQWVIMSVASEEGRRRGHDRYSPGLHHFAWNADSREEVDRFHELLLERGVEILDPPADYGYEPGYYAVFFADPDGLKLELVHVPGENEGG
jgi:catechol 2,3-dioxygenase-like lactoylglutathione lyase family enzyme